MTSIDEIVTSDIGKFGARERSMLRDLLTAWNDHGLPEDFYDEDVKPCMNMNSGYVFLTNSDYQVALLNGERLELWHNCPYCGHEGFADEMAHDAENEECTRYLVEIGVVEED